MALGASSHQPELTEAAIEPFRRIRVPEAHALEQGDEDVEVAAVDRGVSLGHAEMQRKWLAGYNTVDSGLGQVRPTLKLVGDSWGIGFHPQDQVGHGSMVAGIVGAQGWHVHRGVAAKALVLPIRVLAAAQASSEGARVGEGAVGDIGAGVKMAGDPGSSGVLYWF